ncbi:helix-turn-helix domain-containing protein [Pseudomonas sp. JH-2]|uniref:GlxA family transcriptional regulator n=1 Tax=Pseudomonas sp. JH-2 TaxID=3114998 RepID=UPI002E26A50D|nr:helix-turn-helix domain-containing protein [Pseudomonas sp. JH-2]
MHDTAPAHVNFLLQDGFDLFALALALEPLRQANLLAGASRLGWALLSLDGGAVRASSGLCVNCDASLAQRPPAELLVLCGPEGCRPASGDGDCASALLQLIGRSQGLALAQAVRTILDEERSLGATQAAAPPHAGLQRAIALMRAHLTRPLGMPQLAATLGLSRRQVERLFQRYLQCTPARYYQRLRLAHARQLLRGSARPLAEVARACGFPCQQHFARCYREHFGRPPTQERRQAALH